MLNRQRRRRAKGWTLAALAAAVGLGTATARADQVVLKNGDTLSGHITTLDGGKLTINVLGLGDVKVDVGQIATIGTDGPVELRLADGTAQHSRLLPAPAVVASTRPSAFPTSSPTTGPSLAGPGDVLIDGGLMPGGTATPLAQISQINPPPPPGPVWAGSVTAGALLIRGNAQTDTLNLGINVSRKTEQDTVAFTGSYLYGRTRDRATGTPTTTAENWQIEGQYDYNFTPRFYGFLDALARKDRIAFLDIRFIPSGGFGYKFIKEPDFTLNGELGLAWVYENYTNGTPTKEDVSAKAAYHLTKKFNDAVSLFHDTEYLQSVQRGRNFLITTDLGVRAQLTKHFFGEAKITLIHDSSPANGALKNDVFYAVSLGYNI